MILLIDNYDSFTYNLVQYFGEAHPDGRELTVVRNDALSVEDVRTLAPTRIVLSPGPCTPNEAGISLEIVTTFAATVPLLGVCLGHQAIGQAFGGTVLRGRSPVHGKTSRMRHLGTGIFSGLERSFTVARYHSLVVDEETLPAKLEPLAWAEDDGAVMAIAHRAHRTCIGLQFHPESIATEHGKELLRRFVELPPPER